MIIEAFMQFIAAAVGTFGFSVLFRVPEKYYLDCSLIGGAGWLVCWILDNGVHTWTFLATLLATLFVTLASRLWAAERRSPATDVFNCRRFSRWYRESVSIRRCII